MKVFLLVIALAALAGCNTAPVSPEKAIQVSADSSSENARPIAGGGEAVVIRDSGWSGSGCKLGVYIDGKYAGALGSSEKINLFLKGGTSILSAKPIGKLFCGSSMAARAERSISISVAQGEKLHYRIATSGSGEMSIFPVPQ